MEPCEIVVHPGVYPGGVQVGKPGGGPLPPLLITAAKKADGAFEEVVFDSGRKITKAVIRQNDKRYMGLNA